MPVPRHTGCPEGDVMGETPDMHEWMYGDPKRVRLARMIAESNLAQRRIGQAWVDAFTPLLDAVSVYLARRFDRPAPADPKENNRG